MSKAFDLMEQMAYVMRETLNEDNYSQLTKKGASISTLQPKFKGRVHDVKGHGGVRLVNVEPDKWSFTVASGTTVGKKYDAIINFDNLMDIVAKHSQNKFLWTKDHQKIDLRKMARAVMEDANLQIYCSCPADLYYGGHYIRTKRDSKYTAPETRPPKIRNPKEYGAYCKHLQALLDALTFYANTMAHFLKTFYAQQIVELEGVANKQQAIVNKGAEFLKQQQINKTAGEGGKFKKGSV